MKEKEEIGAWSLAWWTIKVLDSKAKRDLRKLVITHIIAAGIFFGAAWPIKFFVDGVSAGDSTLVLKSIIASVVILIVSRLTVAWFLYHEHGFRKASFLSVDRSILSSFLEKSVGQIVREGKIFNTGNIESGRANMRTVVQTTASQITPAAADFLVAFLFIHIIAINIAGIIWIQIGIFSLWTYYLNRWARKKLIPIEREGRRVNRYRTDRLNNAETVIDNSCAESEKNEIEKTSDSVLEDVRRVNIIRTFHSSARSCLFTLSTPIAMYILYREISVGTRTLGDIFPIISWINVVLNAMRGFGGVDNTVNSVAPSVASLRRVIESESDLITPRNATKVVVDRAPNIVFDAVSFSYNPPKVESEVVKKPVRVLRNLSLEIRPGERIAVFGKSGAGKTTIAQLLLRHSDPSSGRILIDGVDLRNIDLDSWRDNVAHIPQSATLFNGTLRMNAQYGLNGKSGCITEDDFDQSMRRFGAYFGERLTDGYDTLVGPKGLQLSGGQRQRVLIARAALKNSMFMIIDEATSNQDPDTEAQLQDSINKLLGDDKSCFLIAHRLSTARVICNRFLVLRPLGECNDNESQIEADCRSFEELYEVSPTFRRFAEIQQIKI